MDTKTGDIYTGNEAKKMRETLGGRLKMMELPPTLRQFSRKPVNPNAVGRVGRNEPCPCGSKKKFKKCCLTR